MELHLQYRKGCDEDCEHIWKGLECYEKRRYMKSSSIDHPKALVGIQSKWISRQLGDLNVDTFLRRSSSYHTPNYERQLFLFCWKNKCNHEKTNGKNDYSLFFLEKQKEFL